MVLSKLPYRAHVACVSKFHFYPRLKSCVSLQLLLITFRCSVKTENTPFLGSWDMIGYAYVQTIRFHIVIRWNKSAILLLQQELLLLKKTQPNRIVANNWKLHLSGLLIDGSNSTVWFVFGLYDLIILYCDTCICLLTPPTKRTKVYHRMHCVIVKSQESTNHSRYFPCEWRRQRV